MPVPTMNESWDSRAGILGNGEHDLTGIRSINPTQSSVTRSQDDETVRYLFQRPQVDDINNFTQKRWAIGDDSILEQSRPTVIGVNELEQQFHHRLSINNRHSQLSDGNKKIWSDQNKSLDKGIFPNNPWAARENSWENETSALGVVEYVLGGSPTSKDLDSRINRIKNYPVPAQGVVGEISSELDKKTPSPFEGGDADRSDMESGDLPPVVPVMIQNGLDDGTAFRYQTIGPGGAARPQGNRASSPGEEIKLANHPFLKQDMGFIHQPIAPLHLSHQDFHIDNEQYEPVRLDHIQLDYSNQPIPPSMDSPNFTLDYSQQMLQRQQPIAILAQQQFTLAAQQQQLGLGSNALNQSGQFLMNPQEQFTVGIPFATAPAMMQQPFYSVQTPWGVYPANLIQQQTNQTPQQAQLTQQPMIRGQSGRPITPSQPPDAISTPANNMTGPATGTGYHLVPAYYDRNGQLIMGDPRSLGAPLRLVSPAPVILNTTNQQGAAGTLGSNTLRVITSQGQPLAAAVSNTNTQQSNNLGFAQSNSIAYNMTSNSLFTPSANLNAPTSGAHQSQNPFLAPNLASMTPGTIGTGLTNHRRDSPPFKRQPVPPLNTYYNSLGISSPAGPMGLVQPGQTLTPPLSASNPNITLGGFGRSVGFATAPGSETKLRLNTVLAAGPANTLFPPRNMTRATGMIKESTGRSHLLEEFRNNRNPNLQLKDLVNHVVEFSQDQHGSRFIQQKLERATTSEKIMVFNEILASAYSLMTDVFGNYVIQKFFEFGTPDQKQILAQRVRGHVLQLALQMYGCRVIQKAVESIPSDMQVEIVKEIDGHVIKCVKDQNGNHVVQKCIESIDSKHLQFIIDAFRSQVYTLSTHPYGCRVIQRILEHCTQEQITPILEELHSRTESLVTDQYGNYVIQHVLEHGRQDEKTKIIQQVQGKVLILAQHKFASNVVEKCVSHSSRQERAQLIDEVCAVIESGQSALYVMMKDQFANYVVQKMIDVAEPNQRRMLMQKIRPHVNTLRKYTYGKHILTKLEKYFNKNNSCSDLGAVGMKMNGTMS